MSSKEGNPPRGRQDRLIQEEEHDPYMIRGKLEEPTVCRTCGVLFAEGRWQWPSETPQDAHEILCPACQRIRDGVPAGFLTLSGDFAHQHRDEIMRLIANKVDDQKAQHPMKRLMGVKDEDDDIVLTFTDRHLPRGVGTALESAYEGDFEIHYTDEAGIVRAWWKR